MLISQAFAQTSGAVAAAPGPSFALPPWLPYAAIIAIFYFLVLRPQQEKAKIHQTMIAELKAGDKIVTSGGIIASVIHAVAEESEITVEIADGVRVRVQKTAIVERAADKKAA